MAESLNTIPQEPREVIREDEIGNYTDLHRPLTLWPKFEAASQANDSPVPLIVRSGNERQMLVRGASIYAHNIITGATQRPKGLSDRMLSTIIEVGYRHDTEVDELFVTHSPRLIDVPGLERPAVSLSDVQRFSQSIFKNRQGALWLSNYIRSHALGNVDVAWRLGARDITTGGIAVRAHNDSFGTESVNDNHFTNYTVKGITVDRIKRIHEDTPSRIPAQRYVLGNYLKLACAGLAFEEPQPYTKPPVLFDESYKPAATDESSRQLPAVAWAPSGLAREVAFFAEQEKFYPASAVFCDPANPEAGVIASRVSVLLDDIFRRKTLSPQQAGLSDLKLKTLCVFDALQQPLDRDIASVVTAKAPTERIALAEISDLARMLGVGCDYANIMDGIQAADYKRQKSAYDPFEVGFLQERFEGILLREELSPESAYILSRYVQALRCAADTINKAFGDPRA